MAKLSRKQAKNSWEDLENAEGEDEEQESDNNSIKFCMKCLCVYKIVYCV